MLGAVPAAAGPWAGWRRRTPGGDFGVTTAAGEEGTCRSGGGAALPPAPFRSGFGAAPLELGDAPSGGAASCRGLCLRRAGALRPAPGVRLGLRSPRPQRRWARGSSIPEPEVGVGDAGGIRWCRGTVCEDKEAAQNGRGARTPPEAGICCRKRCPLPAPSVAAAPPSPDGRGDAAAAPHEMCPTGTGQSCPRRVAIPISALFLCCNRRGKKNTKPMPTLSAPTSEGRAAFPPPASNVHLLGPFPAFPTRNAGSEFGVRAAGWPQEEEGEVLGHLWYQAVLCPLFSSCGGALAGLGPIAAPPGD